MSRAELKQDILNLKIGELIQKIEKSKKELSDMELELCALTDNISEQSEQSGEASKVPDMEEDDELWHRILNKDRKHFG